MKKLDPTMMAWMLSAQDADTQLPTKRYGGGHYYMFYNGHPNRNRPKNKKLNRFTKAFSQPVTIERY